MKPPPWSLEKLSSMKPVPGAQKVGVRCSRNSKGGLSGNWSGKAGVASTPVITYIRHWQACL